MYSSEPSSIAKLGFINLIPAMRLMDNFKTISYTQVLDESGSGCSSCPHFASCKLHTSDHCIRCLKKKYKLDETVKYVNEKNRYGEKTPLQRNALLLFLYLHYLHPDQYGLVQVTVSKAAETIHCTERSIRNNLHLLNKLNYISLQKGEYPGTYFAFIQSYPQYFHTMEQGGRNYISLSYNTFQTLTEEKEINTIRLSLRILTSAIDGTTPKLLHNETSYKEIRRLLPNYCCNKFVRRITETKTFHTLFQIAHTAHTVFIDIVEAFNPNKLAENLKKDCLLQIDECIKSINEKANQLGYKLGKHWFLTKKEKADIANIALQYQPIHIINALHTVYDSFILQKRKIDNVGALVRTITQSNSRFYDLNS